MEVVKESTVVPMQPNKRIPSDRCRLGDEQRQIWCVVPESGTAYEEIFEPGYWRLIAAKMRIYDRIEVIPDDGSYFAELIVLAASRSEIRVHALRKLPLPKEGEQGVSGLEYRVVWAGPYARWRIARSDGAKVKDGYPTEEAAQLDIASNYARPMV